MARSSSGSKRWGQHFLKSRRIAARIVEALEIRPSDLVIEIGPGKGILTGILLQSPAKVIGVEIDPGLACYLKDRLPKLEILSTDFLKLDLSQFGRKVKLIGNIPFQISTPIIEKLIEERTYWRVAVLTFQTEFATRLLASPRTKSYGSLSIFFQFHLKGERLFTIPPHFFRPRPKVTATVIRIRPGRRNRDPAFERFIKNLFARRRKMLRTILKGRTLPFYYQRLRPEELSPRSLFRLYQRVGRLDTTHPEAKIPP